VILWEDEISVMLVIGFAVATPAQECELGVVLSVKL